MIKVYKKFLLMIAISIALFIVIFNSPSYAFFSDTKIIKCTSVEYINGRIFKYEKKLLSKPTLTRRGKGVWKPYCSDGKLIFNDDSIMCKGKMYNSILDLVTKEYSYKFTVKPVGKDNKPYTEVSSDNFVCLIDKVLK